MVDDADIKVPKPDEEYRKKSIKYMFKTALFGAIGGAAFFGLLNNFFGAAISYFSASAAAASATAGGAATAGAAAAGAGLGLTPVGWLAVAGMLAVGVASTYMSQIESTKLRELQDDHLAMKNADMLVKCEQLQHGHHKTQEFAQNQREDGKCWKEVVSQEAATQGRVH